MVIFGTNALPTSSQYDMPASPTTPRTPLRVQQIGGMQMRMNSPLSPKLLKSPMSPGNNSPIFKMPPSREQQMVSSKPLKVLFGSTPNMSSTMPSPKEKISAKAFKLLVGDPVTPLRTPSKQQDDEQNLSLKRQSSFSSLLTSASPKIKSFATRLFGATKKTEEVAQETLAKRCDSLSKITKSAKVQPAIESKKKSKKKAQRAVESVIQHAVATATPILFNKDVLFNKVLNKAELRPYFERYAKTECSEENITFWKNIEYEYKNWRNKKQRLIHAWQIFATYIEPSSNCALNIDSFMVCAIKKRIDEAAQNWSTDSLEDLYDDLQRTIEVLMQDTFARFLDSELFKEMYNHQTMLLL